MERTVAETGNELYALPPHAFTAARTGAATAATQSGDRAAAREITALKRPSAAAWLVNLIALRRPDALAALLDLGATMRAAQAGGSTAAQLRELSHRRRRELDSLLALATTLATEAGEPTPTRAHLAEVESTLAATMVDDEAARLVTSGRVLKALAHGGFGTLTGAFPPADDATPNRPRPEPDGETRGAHRAPTTAPVRTAPQRHPSADDEAAEAAERRRRDRQRAEDRRDQASQTLADATDVESAANGRAEQLTQEIAELRDQLDQAHRDARAARQARLDAERELAAAQRRLARLD